MAISYLASNTWILSANFLVCLISVKYKFQKFSYVSFLNNKIWKNQIDFYAEKFDKIVKFSINEKTGFVDFIFGIMFIKTNIHIILTLHN